MKDTSNPYNFFNLLFEKPDSKKMALEQSKLGAYATWYLSFQFVLYAWALSTDIIDVYLFIFFALLFIYLGFLVYRGKPLISIIIFIIYLLILGYSLMGGQFKIIMIAATIFSFSSARAALFLRKLK